MNHIEVQANKALDNGVNSGKNGMQEGPKKKVVDSYSSDCKGIIRYNNVKLIRPTTWAHPVHVARKKPTCNVVSGTYQVSRMRRQQSR